MEETRSQRSRASSVHQSIRSNQKKATLSNAFATDIHQNQNDIQSQAGSIHSKAETQKDYPEVHLVPCRWKHNGWKYANVDSQNQFFKNQHRLNSVGYSPFEKTYGSRVLPGSEYPTREYDEKQRFENTTYSQFFHKKETVQEKEQEAALLRNVRLPQKLDRFGGINWAGNRHPRLNFHKHKDEINQWTEVLFRS